MKLKVRRKTEMKFWKKEQDKNLQGDDINLIHQYENSKLA